MRKRNKKITIKNTKKRVEETTLIEKDIVRCFMYKNNNKIKCT